MRIAIVGAGAIGSVMGGLLSRRGHDVTLICRGAHLAAVRANGLTVKAPDGDFVVHPKATDAPEDVGAQDAVILTAKAYSLAELSPRLRNMLTPQTPILTTQNGIPYWYLYGAPGPGADEPLESADPGGILWKHLGPERAVAAPVRIPADLIAPGVASIGYEPALSLGAPKGGHAETLRALAAAFGDCGLPTTLGDAHTIMWSKLRTFLPGATVSLLTQTNSATLPAIPGMKEYQARLMNEAIAIARAWGVELPPPPAAMARVRRVAGDKASIWVDFEKGRPVEINVAVRAPIELAHRRAVPVPFLENHLALIEAKLALRERQRSASNSPANAA